MNYEKLMQTAIELAEKGRGFTSPNPLVGAVVEKDGKIVGKGYHKKAGDAHAEVNAINDAGDKARGASIIVTLEPCNHTGRTPPCTEKIISAGIKKVVIGMEDPNPGVKGNGAAYLQEKGLEVVSGVCEDIIKKQNEFFIKYITTKLAFVILKSGCTLDGKIAANTGDSKWITNEGSRKYVHQIRHSVDAILTGIGTVKADDPSMTVRLQNFNANNPVRVILDTNLEISAEAKILNPDSERIIICSNSVSKEKKELLEKKGVEIIETPLKDSVVDIKKVIEILAKRDITSILIEAGSKIAGRALQEKIVDKVMFFYAPKIIGGDGISLCCGSGAKKISSSILVKNINVRRFGDDVLIEGYIT